MKILKFLAAGLLFAAAAADGPVIGYPEIPSMDPFCAS